MSLRLARFRALLGENGSGKSTLAKIIAGAQTADRGTICRDGSEVEIGDPAAARALGIAMVFQELSLAPDLDIVDNMFLGRERPAKVPGFFDRKSEERACRAMLDQLGLAVIFVRLSAFWAWRRSRCWRSARRSPRSPRF